MCQGQQIAGHAGCASLHSFPPATTDCASAPRTHTQHVSMRLQASQVLPRHCAWQKTARMRFCGWWTKAHAPATVLRRAGPQQRGEKPPSNRGRKGLGRQQMRAKQFIGARGASGAARLGPYVRLGGCVERSAWSSSERRHTRRCAREQGATKRGLWWFSKCTPEEKPEPGRGENTPPTPQVLRKRTAIGW